VDWTHLSEYQEQWWAFVNTIMNLWIPEETVHFLTNRASEDGLCSVQLMSAIIIHVDPVWDMCNVSSDFPISVLDSLIFDINSQGDSKLTYVALYLGFGYQDRSLDLRFR